MSHMASAAAATAALAFCSPAPPCHGRGAGGIGVASCWTPTPTARCPPLWPGSIEDSSRRTQALRSSRRRPPPSWSHAGQWPAPPPPLLSSPLSMLGEANSSGLPRARKRARRWKNRLSFGAVLRVRGQQPGPPDATVAVAAAEATGPGGKEEKEAPRETVAKHLGVLLLPPLGWFPAAVAGALKRRPAAVEPVLSAVVEPVAAATAGRSMWGVGMPGVSVLQVGLCCVSSACILPTPIRCSSACCSCVLNMAKYGVHANR